MKGMSPDKCSGMCKWICPSIVGVTAGVIIFVAGLSKLIAGEQMLTGVGGMALGIFGVESAGTAYVLGMIAALIEVVGGISFAAGCKLTSRWAALGLSIVMLVALVVKLSGIPYAQATGVWQLISGTVGAIQIEVLLLAVFVAKAIKLIPGCGACCGGVCEVKK